MDYYSMGYSQYGDPNAYRGDPYRGAQTPANSEGSAMNVYSHAVPAQIPTPAPLVQNMQAAHQRTQSTGAPVNSAHITNMQHLYQQKSNQPQALNTQNYYQQHWTWQDYQQPGVDMGGNSSMQHQRMKYMRHHGQQRFQFGQNFAQQSQTLIPPQNWTNPAGAEMGDSTVQATNPVSSQLQQSLAQLQNQRAHPIYYPSAQTGAPAADYNNQHKNTKYYPKQDYSKIQTWQGTSANPVGQKNRTWNNEVYQNQAGGLSSARPPASYRGGGFGVAAHKDDFFPGAATPAPSQPLSQYTDPQHHPQNINPPVPPFSAYNQLLNTYYPSASTSLFNSSQQDRNVVYDRQRAVDNRAVYPMPDGVDYRTQPSPMYNPLQNPRVRPFQQIGQGLQVKHSHLNQRNSAFKRQQNDRNRRTVQFQKRRKADVKNTTSVFTEVPVSFDSKKFQDRGRGKMRFTMEDGSVEAYFKNSFLDDPWSHLTPEETPIF